MALFSALIVIQVIQAITVVPGIVLSGAALIAGAFAALAYSKWKILHTYLSLLSPVVLLFPVLFIFNPQIARVTFPESEIPAPDPVEFNPSLATSASDSVPVVMIVLDEFPLTTLLDEQMQIDRTRFPNFAGLADQAYWFRNATTVSDSTLVSIPTILSGVAPILDEKRLPTLADYPENLFTLLAGTHQLEIVENGTRLSPFPEDQAVASTSERIRGLLMDLTVVYGHVVLPDDLAAGLPAIDQSWNSFRSVKLSTSQYRDFGDFTHVMDRSANIFRDFSASIEKDDPPSLYYLHAMLPHKPWQYLPGGKNYTLTPDSIDGQIRLSSPYGTYPAWESDQSLIDYHYRRHALQAGYVDGLVGELIERLQAAELFERSLVIITSDHGASFIQNDYSRRASETNLADIMWVPLFIKLPFQEQGITSDRNVESIDILPTIVDALELEVDWEMNGQSALDATLPERNGKSILAGTNRLFEMNPQSTLRTDSLLRKARTIRSGAWGRMYGVQEYAHLTGRPIAEFELLDVDSQVTLEGEAFFTNVSLDAGFILTDIRGRVRGENLPDEPEYLAVGINGVIRSVIELGPQFYQSQEFAALVPEASFRAGRNEVDVFFVRDMDGEIELQRLQKDAQTRYSLAIEGDENTEILISPDGQKVPIDGRDVEGFVRSDIGQDNTIVVVSGWSLDVANADMADVLVFVNGELRTSLTPDVRRSDVEAVREEAVGLTPGFRTSLPLSDFGVLNEEHVRVFGISQNSASELVYTSNWVFSN
ncbi:MAG: sulfatase-like hydrolase/transferase [Gammaproteobacteria bacterium]|nr:sulfatase-like hydrolase/transferase [Gammaproteobacteria bacterium]MDP6731507.1 sulfatase-like hydrolase/transferase [Gammaproteobacteria bacterium]